MNKLLLILFVIVSLVLMAIGTGAIWIYASPIYTIFEKLLISGAIIAFISLPMMIIWDSKAQ
jgi:hypothetical protein